MLALGRHSNAGVWLAIALIASLGLSSCVQNDPVAIEDGTVLGAVPTDQPGENNGAGAVAGMVVLGAAGGSVGEGAGKALAVVGGIIAGAAIGTAVESAAQRHDGMAYTIQLADGRVMTLIIHINAGDVVFPVGAHVILETRGHEQQLSAQTS